MTKSQIEALRAFTEAVLSEAYEFGGGDVDGGWLQEKAHELGVLQKATPREPCGDNCACAEAGALWEEFEAGDVECYRIAPFVLGRQTPSSDVEVDDLIADGEPGI